MCASSLSSNGSRASCILSTTGATPATGVNSAIRAVRTTSSAPSTLAHYDLAMLRLRFFGFLSLAAIAMVLHATERSEGIAYARGSDQIVFRETDGLFTREGISQRLVLYRCPGGAPFGRKWVRDVPSAVAPDFDFTDARDGYHEGVRTERGVRQIFVQENAHSPMQVKPLPADPNAVLDAGFDAFVRM